MKSIEETHPSLKGKGYSIDYSGRDIILEEGGILYIEEDIQKHTVDKQKLREALTTLFRTHGKKYLLISREEYYLFLKELGLEEDND